VSQARAQFSNLDGYVELPDDATFWYEDPLDHGHLLAVVRALHEPRTTERGVDRYRAEAALVGGLVRETGVLRGPPQNSETTDCGRPIRSVETDRGPLLALNRLRGADHDLVRVVVRPASAGGAPLDDGLTLTAFEDFGVYVFRSTRVYLLFRCGPVGQNGNGGHAHNDQLGIEMVIDGEDWFRDPGTYLYTPLPARRNAYRSVTAHWAPRSGDQEPSGLEDGLFRLARDPGAEVVERGPTYVVARHTGFEGVAARAVSVGRSRIEVTDLVPGTGVERTVELNSPADLAQILGAVPAFSPGYGVRVRAEPNGALQT
jgi:hypothetical protein